MVKRLLAWAGQTGFTEHNLRDIFATFVERKVGDLTVSMKLIRYEAQTSQRDLAVLGVSYSIGVIIIATQTMKVAGGFDGAIGTFEKAVQYLRSQLTEPMVLMGLEAPRSFQINHIKANNK